MGSVSHGSTNLQQTSILLPLCSSQQLKHHFRLTKKSFRLSHAVQSSFCGFLFQDWLMLLGW